MSRRLPSTTFFPGEEAMPRHDFLCRACKKEFSKILTPWECDKGSSVRTAKARTSNSDGLARLH